jgi:DNA (cytosine-5)-methyltransferase 1
MKRRATKKNAELVSLSFFSGCLGLDLGLERAGIHQVLACDIDRYCRQSIVANRPDLAVIDDINRYDVAEIRSLAGLKKGQRPTLVVGGPPCQAFSTAGKRQGFADPRGNVFLRYIQLIEELQPEFAVIENVRGLLSVPLRHRPHNQRGGGFPALSEDELPGGALRHILSWLARLKYAVSFNLYNSANYGVPQVRERVILIASRDGKRVPWLRPTHAEAGRYGLLPWATFRQATKGLDEESMTGAKFPEARLRYYRMLSEGQYWKHLPSLRIQKAALGNSFHAGGGKTGFFRRLSMDKPSPTLVTHPAMPATDLCHPSQDRPLSIQEYKRLQQFPDDWIVAGGVNEQYRQLGNAVPVGLGEALGRALLNHLAGKVWDDQSIPGFPFSRYKNNNERTWAGGKEGERRAQTELDLA